MMTIILIISIMIVLSIIMVIIMGFYKRVPLKVTIWFDTSRSVEGFLLGILLRFRSGFRALGRRVLVL